MLKSHSFVEIPPPVPQFTATSDVTEALRTFERFMKQLDNALYKVLSVPFEVLGRLFRHELLQT